MSANPATTKSEVIPTQADLIGNTRPLVMTKIRIPRRRPELLSRRRLVDFIHAHLDCKLMLIAAPAGYGKTSLLTDFASETELPVCWYTLDAFDRDLRVFLEHLIAAITQHFPNFGEQSRAFLRGISDPGSHLLPMAATLAREIYDTIPEYFVLILDDYHTAEDQEKIAEFLGLFVNYVDENCHLILASRTLAALPNLSLLVARKQAAGLSIDELCFLPQEVQALAQQNYGLALSPEQAEKLAEQTEGWITGLLLTIAPHWENVQKEVAIQGRINVSLYDYLSEQVLNQQPAPLRDFLLASSVLAELSPELCTAVLGTDRPAELMDQLRTRNLFVVEFEDDNHLRYHDLFKEFLQASLRRQDVARFRELTRRAAKAYAARGEWEQAVSHYLALQDYDPIAEILEHTATRMYETGRWDTLAGWIDALPEAIRATRPHFLIHRGNIHSERGEQSQALTLYDQAAQASRIKGARDQVALALAQKGCVLRYQGRYAEAIAECHEAQALAASATAQEKSIMAVAQKNIGLCYLGLGQVAESLKTLQEALRLYTDLDDTYNIGNVNHDLGLGHELAGNLNEAANHYQAALQCWRQLGNPGAWANTLNNLSVIHYLRGDYDTALQLLSDALSKVRQVGNLRVEAAIWASLGDLHRDLGEGEQAQQAYNEGLQIATRAGEGFLVTYALDGLGNIFRLQGDLAQATKLLSQAVEQAENHHSAYETGLCHTSLGILAGEEGDLAAARQHLDLAIRLYEASGFKRELARAYLHRAQATFLAGECHEALANLEQALTLANQLGFDQFLVVDGHKLQPLLRYATMQGLGGETLSHIFDRIRVHQAHLRKRAKPTVQDKPQPSLKIYTLCKPWVELKGENVQWTITQSKELFFCLLQHPQGLRKEEIGALFWPEHSPQKLEAIFRSTLYRLRRALFRESVVFEANLYRFNRDSDYWLDVDAFDSLLDQAGQVQTSTETKVTLLEEAVALYKGDYLEGIYGDWCTLERERLRGRYLAALEMLVRLCADRGKLQRPIELYQSILAQDPYHDVANRGLMRCYFRLGDRAAAIRQFQTFASILHKDLGLNPTSETMELYRQIMGGATT